MDTQFVKDMSMIIDVDGVKVTVGFYNLILSIRDVKMFCRGMKPYKEWRLKDVKEYFGIKGNKFTVAKQLQAIYDDASDDSKKKEQ